MMPLRYLLLVLHAGRSMGERLPQIGERAGMTVTYEAGGNVLMTNGPGDVLSLPEGGLVVGKLFHRYGYPQQVETMPADTGARIVASGGQDLIERFWGSYVAVISTPDGATRVIRDPSSGLPCYFCSFDGGVAFASDGPILSDAGLVQPSVDWEAVGRSLYLDHLPPQQTAIAGISQVLGGYSVAVHDRVLTTSRHWSPWDHIAPMNSRDGATTGELLDRVVCMTMKAWSSCFARPIVGMSGGLDSSIVTAGLARAGASLGCVTLTTEDPLGDERRYAQQVCEAVGAPLIALPFREAGIDFGISVAAGVPVPCGKTHEQSFNGAVREAALQLGGDAFFVGAGGDNVFYLTHSARPLVDRYDIEGLSRGTLSTLRDLAEITGASLWQVAAEARRLRRSRETRISWNVASLYLARDFVEAQAAMPIDHPWLVPPGNVPMGKLSQVKLLLRAMNHLEHRDKALSAPMISPLLSQPIVEFCLAVPSWETTEGGVDRAVARRAFASSLPAKIIGRGGKGSPEGFVARLIEVRSREIEERLLEGMLAQHRLIDRAALEATLRNRPKIGATDCARLMSLLDTEAWAGHWSSGVSSHFPS